MDPRDQEIARQRQLMNEHEREIERLRVRVADLETELVHWRARAWDQDEAIATLEAQLEWLDHVAADVKRRNEEVWEPMEEYGELPRYTPESNLIVQQARRIAALEADRERLDWLGQSPDHVRFEVSPMQPYEGETVLVYQLEHYRNVKKGYSTLREAIDKAREGSE